MKAANCKVCGNPVPQKPGRGRPKTTHESCRLGVPSVDTTLTAWILGALADEPLTDDEMEVRSGRSHQSVSAIRRSLVKRGKVRDSGLVGMTRTGHRATAWERVS